MVERWHSMVVHIVYINSPFLRCLVSSSLPLSSMIHTYRKTPNHRFILTISIALSLSARASRASLGGIAPPPRSLAGEKCEEESCSDPTTLISEDQLTTRSLNKVYKYGHLAHEPLEGPKDLIFLSLPQALSFLLCRHQYVLPADAFY